MRIVVRNRVMSLRSSVNGESGPSWSEISRTFHGQSVVIAVSEMQKNAYTNRSTTVPMTAPELSVLAIAVAVPAAAAAVSAAARCAKAGPAFVANAAAAAATKKARRAAEKTTPAAFGKDERLPREGGVGFGAGASFELAVAETETDRVTSDSRGETPPRLPDGKIFAPKNDPSATAFDLRPESFPGKGGRIPPGPSRRRRGAARRARAHARVDATACGCAAPDTRGGPRTGAAGRNSPPGAAFAPFSRHRYESNSASNA